VCHFWRKDHDFAVRRSIILPRPLRPLGAAASIASRDVRDHHDTLLLREQYGDVLNLIWVQRKQKCFW
jgi:hypothetical protein